MERLYKGDEGMLDVEMFPEGHRKIIEAINSVSGLGGEPYAGSTEFGRRNPVKPDTGPLLTQLALAQNPKHIFEMGTAYGLSALYLGLGAPKAEMTTVEFDPDVAEKAQATLDEAGLSAQVCPVTVNQLVHELGMASSVPIDLVFIDHDKKSYLPDFQAIEPFLAEGALILGDNVNDRRAETQDFIDYVTEKYGASILPTQAGLLVART